MSQILDPSGSTATSTVDVATSVLPTGAATAADQTTGNASLSSIDGKVLTDTQLRATPVPVSGSVDVATIVPPTLTKGTQGATGFSTQDLKDAGRTPVRYYATAAAAGATNVETAITLTKSSANDATTTGVSFVIPSGKRFRAQFISFATRGNNTATAQVTIFRIRVNTAGAVIVTTTPIELAVRSATPATANAWDRVLVEIPDGWEILGDGTLQFGVTALATYTTNAPTWDVTIIGFEY